MCIRDSLGPHADLVKVALAGIPDSRIFLRDDDNQVVVARRRFDRPHRRLATDLEWPHVAGQLHLGPEWDHGVLARSLGMFRHDSSSLRRFSRCARVCAGELRTVSTPVSYTHLTLPTSD